jgi:hypothetical protein
MAIAITDTHKLISKLQQRGFSAQQAEGITAALQELDTSNLVTKADLRDALRDLELRIYKFMFAAMSAQTALTVALLEYLK